MPDQRARDGHALALSAGELIWTVIHPLIQFDLLERLSRHLATLGRRNAAVTEGQFNIAEGGGSRQKVKCLEDEPNLSIARPREFFVAEFARKPAPKPIAARGRRIKAADQVHQRGFM